MMMTTARHTYPQLRSFVVRPQPRTWYTQFVYRIHVHFTLPTNLMYLSSEVTRRGTIPRCCVWPQTWPARQRKWEFGLDCSVPSAMRKTCCMQHTVHVLATNKNQNTAEGRSAKPNEMKSKVTKLFYGKWILLRDYVIAGGRALFIIIVPSIRTYIAIHF